MWRTGLQEQVTLALFPWGKCPSLRGEGGEAWLGGPLWSPDVPLQLLTRSPNFF